MKTNSNTLNVAQRNTAAADWLNQPHSFLSEILETKVSNLQFLCVLMSALCASIAFILATDWCQFYGWSAFFALAAVNAALPIVSLFKEGR